jgi:hypothetical protein
LISGPMMGVPNNPVTASKSGKVAPKVVKSMPVPAVRRCTK